jgi:hypothetical protein
MNNSAKVLRSKNERKKKKTLIKRSKFKGHKRIEELRHLERVNKNLLLDPRIKN